MFKSRNFRWSAVIAAILLIIVIGLGFFSHLPLTRPAIFEVRYNGNSGMIPYAHTIRISAEQSNYTIYKEGFNVQVEFDLSSDELDQVYQTLRNNRIDRIWTYTEEVLDRGGGAVQVQAGLATYQVSNSGSSFIMSPWQTNYDNAVGAIMRLVQRPIPTNQPPHTFDIRWDESLGGLLTLHLDVGNHLIRLDDDNDPFVPMVRIVTDDPTATYILTMKNYQEETVGEFAVNLSETQGVHISQTDEGFEFEPF